MKKVLGLLVVGLLFAGIAQAGSLTVGAKYLGIWTHSDSANAGVAACSYTLNVGGVVADIGWTIIPNLVIEGDFGLMNASQLFGRAGSGINTQTITVPVAAIGAVYELPAMADGKLIISVGGDIRYAQVHMDNATGNMDYVTYIYNGKGGVNYKLTDACSLFGAVEVGMGMTTLSVTGYASEDLGSGLAVTYMGGLKMSL